jgi:Tol biopolymer transport system component
MTAQILRSSALVIAAALVLTSPMGAQSGYELFQQALSKERAEGKLQEAIALYQRVIDAAGTDHGLAAKAMLQLGRCYETLGNTEARAAYERLIARFPDQADLVAQARVRLAALVRAPVAPAPAAMAIHPLDLGDDDLTELRAVSPDGSKALVLNFSKGENLTLFDFSTRQTRLLTDLDDSMGWITDFVVWSPDSRRVAYVHAWADNEARELRMTTLDGRSSLVYRTERAQTIQPVGWTPDGRTLVVVMSRPDKTVAIGTMPATGGLFTPLRSLGWSYDWGYLTPPRLSPDGRFVAYLEGEAGQRDLHVVSLDGRATYSITDDPGDDFAPIWSPDSRYLAFTSTRLGGVSLWTIELTDGKPVGPPVKLKDGMQSAEMIDWSKRGIFYVQSVATWDLYTLPMDPIEGRPTGSPRPISYSRTGRNVSPAWSPDGKSMAFVSSAAAEPNRRYVVVMPADGGQAREFLIPTSAWERLQSPYELRWFGDGRELGFAGMDSRGAPAAFRLLLDTGEWNTSPLSVVDGTDQIWRREWNRDGSAFYFARARLGTNPGIFERAVNTDAERLVYRFSPRVIGIRPLVFSPDRKWLAFQQWTPLDDDTQTVATPIVIVDVGTGETRTLLEGLRNARGAPENLVGWTASGDLMVWPRQAGSGALEFQLVPVNGGAPRSLTIPGFGPSRPGETSFRLVAGWSPDGRTMMLGRESRIGGETFVIENPLAALPSKTASR